MEIKSMIWFVFLIFLCQVSFAENNQNIPIERPITEIYRIKNYSIWKDMNQVFVLSRGIIDTFTFDMAVKIAMTGDEKIYVASQNQLTRISFDSIPSLQTLTKIFPDTLTQISDLVSIENTLLIIANNQLFIFDGKQIKTIIKSALSLEFKNHSGEIVICKNNEYFYQVRNEKLIRIISSAHKFTFIDVIGTYWLLFLIYTASILILFVYVFRKNNRSYAKQKIDFEKESKKKIEDLIKQNNRLVRQNQKSEDLLANVLPQQTASELKVKGKAQSQRFEMATILFADIQGFTKIAEQMNPDALIDELDRIFYHFDLIIEKYNIEKIKTIGDAYMCAGGIPKKNSTHPVEVVLVALEMQHYLKKLHQQNKVFESKIWDLRIGLHSGPIIAGVVGKKRFSYDIWGDSVNIASRMQSSGEIGKVNISVMTYNLVKTFFQCEYRGRMPVKFKGDVEMYFVVGINPGLADDPERFVPNEKFKLLLSYLHYEDLENEILSKLEDDLPSNIYFHSKNHTINFCSKVDLLATSEQVDEVEVVLLKAAALFYNTGYITGYKDHVNSSIELARDIMPNFSFTSDQIEVVCNHLRLLKLKIPPTNKSDQILSDAYYDYLGSNNFMDQLVLLYKELSENNMAKSLNDWYKEQITYLNTHVFYTRSAKMFCEVDFQDQILLINDALNHTSAQPFL